MYDIQYCFIYRPSDSIVSEDAGIEPRTVTSCDYGIGTRLHLIHTLLDLIHTRLDLIYTRLDLIHTRLDLMLIIFGTGEKCTAVNRAKDWHETVEHGNESKNSILTAIQNMYDRTTTMNMTNTSFFGRSDKFRIPASIFREYCFPIRIGFCKMYIFFRLAQLWYRVPCGTYRTYFSYMSMLDTMYLYKLAGTGTEIGH
jgi:hypothetical protein